MDLLMPKMDGIPAISRLRQTQPKIEVVALTSVLEDASVVGAVKAGAMGYLLNDTKAEELCRAIKAAPAGSGHHGSSVAAGKQLALRERPRLGHGQPQPNGKG